MHKQIPVNPSARADNPDSDARAPQIMRDVAYLRIAFVNVVFVGLPSAGDRGWVMIDAGLIGSAGRIKRAAAERFGDGARPRAIVLTHGHFDHVGALETLSEEWDVPIYAHLLEEPYLNGKASYPPAAPEVGGGLMALLAPLYPRSPVEVSARLKLLPDDGSVPALPEWRAIHVPGHAPGQIALWREADRTLIAGDAVVTTAQESAYAAATQEPELHGPPMYFTPDWESAAASVRALMALQPEVLITGHGRPLRGAEMRAALDALARDFERVAVPRDSRYIEHPARASDGSAYRST